MVEGLADLRAIEGLEDDILHAAAQAINKITPAARTQAARFIRQQINVPSRYLSPSQRRLYVGKKATPSRLESSVNARLAPTSLARYVQGRPRRGQPVRVSVKPGQTRTLQRAFLIRLRSGNRAVSGDTFNLGLAIRLRPGERLQNKTYSRKLDRGLYLLYGPSVDQVFLDNSGSGVATDMADDVAEQLNDEFQRLISERLEEYRFFANV